MVEKKLLTDLFTKKALRNKIVDVTSDNKYAVQENLLLWDIETLPEMDDKHHRSYTIFSKGIPLHVVQTFPIIEGKRTITKYPIDEVAIPQGILIQMIDKGFEKK